MMAKETKTMKAQKAFILAATAILASGCDRIRPSADTAKMESELVPKIVAWSKTTEPTLKISRAFNVDRYQTICIVPDYNCINSVKVSTIGKVDQYYSSFGKCIPENKSAIMIVGDSSAHAVLVDMSDVHFDVPFSGTCVKASMSVLRRKPHRSGAAPTISIGEE